MDNKKIQLCKNCKYYDPTPFPEYNGKLAVCRNKNCDVIGHGKIGIHTLAHSSCFEKINR